MAKKVFRPHIILIIEGRFFLLFCIAGAFAMTGAPVYLTFFSNEENKSEFLFLWAIALGFDLLCGWVISYFWPLIWGKLIVYEDRVVWRCLFHLPVTIFYEEIAFLSVRDLGKYDAVSNNIYNMEHKYLLISKEVLKDFRVDKIKSKKGIIKWAYTPAVGQALYLVLPRRWRKVVL